MKNLKVLVIAIFAAFALSTTSCYFDFDNDGNLFGCESGHGSVVSRTLFLDDFHSLDLQSSADIFIRQGSQQEVVVEGQDNIIDLLDTRIRNGEWEIDFVDCIRNHDKIEIYITIPDIRDLTISGSGKIYGENDWNVGDMKLKISCFSFVDS